MPLPITGVEQKVRGFEAADGAALAADHKFVVDGPVTGPRSLFPKVVAEGSLAALDRQASVAVLNTPFIPVVHGAPGSPAQVDLIPASEVFAGSGSLYLGPFPFPPTSDSTGSPLQVGSTYYNTNSQEMFVFSSAGVWKPQNQASPGALRAFYYFPGADTSIIPQGGAGQPDSKGNFLDFDITGGSTGRDPINVFMNGALLVNDVDYILHEGTATGGDFITFAEPICGGSCIVVQVHAKPSINFAVSAVAIATNLWTKDSINKTFALLDQGGSEVFPQAAVNCLVVLNGRTLQPNVEFTINGSSITFLNAPAVSDQLWMTVGVPTLGEAAQLNVRVTPYMFGGIGNKVADDTNAMSLAIQEVNLTGGTLDIGGGTWRITAQLPVLTKPRVDGAGTGVIYVDYNMGGDVILDCDIAIQHTYPVTSVSVGIFDFAGEFGGDTEVTIIVLNTTGLPAPEVGQIAKLTSTNPIAGPSGPDDFAGQHVYIAAAANTGANQYTVYVPSLLIDTYTTSVQLHILGETPVILKDFTVKANYARVVAEDWVGTFVKVTAAIAPELRGLRFEEGPQGLILAGTYRASTHSLYAKRLRNATASETPAVPGYGVVDAGSYMSVHTDLGGDDCRHVYTTLALDNPTNPRVTWGRAYRPMLNGGSSGNCSSSAYDTHSDAYEAEFINLLVDGGYYSEQSTGSGFQFRGIRARAFNCHVRNAPQGFVMHKLAAAEAGGHVLDTCSYIGTGKGLRIAHDAGLTGVDAQQVTRLKNVTIQTTLRDAISVQDGTLEIEEAVRVIHTGSIQGARAVFLDGAATLLGIGNGRLVHDFSRMTGTPNPRVVTYEMAGCGANINMEVIAGANVWQGWITDNETPDGAPAGVWVIEGECDKAPQNASGGYSQFGPNIRLAPGSLRLRSRVNRGRQTAASLKTGAFSLANADHGQIFHCTGTFTVTVPIADIIGFDFECRIFSATGTITINGPGAVDVTVPAGSRGLVFVVNGKVYAHSTVLTDMT